ncbi:MAG: redoxin domain-containing protein [Longimicrobiaceae bacterium]
MPLRAGDPLPSVILPSHDGQQLSLEEAAGGRSLVVLFFPLAFTSTCTEEMCTMGRELPTYGELDANVAAISVDSPMVLKRFRAECDADFLFLSDFNREASRAFGVLREVPLGPGLRNVSNRAAFVFDPSGEAVYAWHSEDPGELPPFDRIQEALRAL